MTAMTATASVFLFTGPASSTEGREMASALHQSFFQRIYLSEALGADCKKILQELFSIAEECKEPNWDGQGAAAVSPETYSLAYRFIEALPAGIPNFSLGAEPDGHLTLEWYRSPRRILSVSVSPEGDLHYAALSGARKKYGTEPFLSEAPKEIVDLIFNTMNS